MLDVSRVTLGKVELKQERVELAMVLESSLSTVAPRVEARGHRLSVQVPDEPLWLEGDPVRLAQVLTNLLDNAIKYTPEGGEITVDARHEGSQALLVIRDNGIGITTGCLSEVFEPLAQLDQPGSSGGLGLGLALARAITRLHGGDITAHSAGEGQGSTFCVRLPLSQREEDSTEHPEPAVVSDDEVRGLRVLVVDDNVDSANSLAMLLELLGHRPSVALDGESALSMARRQLPDAAILDVALPGMDGTQLAEKLRQLGGDRVLLVALTGLNPSAMEDSNGEGFDHRLTKPADVPQLQQLLGAHVQRMHES
jgi:CheY-like chemotaxis protein